VCIKYRTYVKGLLDAILSHRIRLILGFLHSLRIVAQNIERLFGGYAYQLSAFIPEYLANTKPVYQ